MSSYTPSPEDWATIQDAIRTLSNIVYPKEACGFVFVNVPPDMDLRAELPGIGDPSHIDGVYVTAVDNVAEWPYAQFRIRDADAQWALSTGRCIGVWHSHCSDPAVPSELDVELAIPEMYFLIYAVQDEDLGAFIKDDSGQLVLQTMVMPS